MKSFHWKAIATLVVGYGSQAAAAGWFGDSDSGKFTAAVITAAAVWLLPKGGAKKDAEKAGKETAPDS